MTLLRKVLIGLLVALVAGTAQAATLTLPPAGGHYDSQLGGAYPPPTGTQIVSRDRMDPPADGLYSICYVNAFQTQPAETAWWQAEHPDLLLADASGALVEDENWPGEIFFDISTPYKRQRLIALIGPWIDACARDGFAAIEADNLDSYSRSNRLLTMDHALAFAQLLVERAHANGLAFGQKNTLEFEARGKALGMNFAITESCAVYAECEGYMAVYGRHVLQIEYTDTARSHFLSACAAHRDEISIVLRDRGLSKPDAESYVFEACPARPDKQ